MPSVDARRLYCHLARLLEIVQQRERGPRYLQVAFAIPGWPIGRLYGKGHEGDPRRPNTALHRQRDRGDATSFYGFAYQPDGPVAQGSGGREQDGSTPSSASLPATSGAVSRRAGSGRGWHP
jgi:hypothetical protein